MMGGYDITIHTDHLNLLHKKLANQRILRWRLLLKDFNPTVKSTLLENNLLTDAISRLEMINKIMMSLIGNQQKQN